jgi:hypothetical protein
VYLEGLSTSDTRLLAEREMKRVTSSKAEGKTSHSAERRLSIFPTSNMWRIIAFDAGRKNRISNGGESG